MTQRFNLKDGNANETIEASKCVSNKSTHSHGQCHAPNGTEKTNITQNRYREIVVKYLPVRYYTNSGTVGTIVNINQI